MTMPNGQSSYYAGLNITAITKQFVWRPRPPYQARANRVMPQEVAQG
jgi:hypothetical protein